MNKEKEEHEEGCECEDCCDHSDHDEYCCLICGKDLQEDFAAAAYDKYKDRMKYGD